MTIRVSHHVKEGLNYAYNPENRLITPEYLGVPSLSSFAVTSLEDPTASLLKYQIAEVHIDRDMRGSQSIRHTPYQEFQSKFSDVRVNWHRWAVTRISTGLSSGNSHLSMGLLHHALAIEGVWKGNFILHIADLTEQGIRLRESVNHSTLMSRSLVPGVFALYPTGVTRSVECSGVSSISCLAIGDGIHITNRQADQLLRRILDEGRASLINFLPKTLFPLFLMKGETCQTWVSGLQNEILETECRLEKRERLTTRESPLIIEHAWNIVSVPIAQFESSLCGAIFQGIKKDLLKYLGIN